MLYDGPHAALVRRGFDPFRSVLLMVWMTSDAPKSRAACGKAAGSKVLVGRQHERIAQPEPGEIGPDCVNVTDDERCQAGGIDVARHRGRHSLPRDRFDAADELRIVVV